MTEPRRRRGRLLTAEHLVFIAAGLWASLALCGIAVALAVWS